MASSIPCTSAARGSKVVEGADEIPVSYSTKDAAAHAGRARARADKTEHVIHNQGMA